MVDPFIIIIFSLCVILLSCIIAVAWILKSKKEVSTTPPILTRDESLSLLIQEMSPPEEKPGILEPIITPIKNVVVPIIAVIKKTCKEKFPGSFNHGTDCYKCPDNQPRRTIYAIDGDRACEGDCPITFSKDLNGMCFKCPDGYNRNLEPVTSAKACTKGLSFFDTKPAIFTESSLAKAEKLGSV